MPSSTDVVSEVVPKGEVGLPFFIHPVMDLTLYILRRFKAELHEQKHGDKEKY